MSYPTKIEGQICNDCGQAKYVKNPKTGKVFCEKKCWLDGQPANLVKPPFKSPGEFKKEADQTAWGKCKYGFLLEAFKVDMPLEEAEIKAEAWAEASMRRLP